MDIERRRLGKTDLYLPILSLGTSLFGNEDFDENECIETVKLAIEVLNNI